MTREETHYELYLRERAEHAEARAEQAEAKVQRVAEVFEPYVDCPDHDDDCDSIVCELRQILDGDQ